MSKARIMPHDTESARTVMKVFSECAYAVAYKEKFQAAVKILYGTDFVITEDLSKRMQFACIICNREMNSENAMQEHYRSGPHQKNRDKRNREGGGSSFSRDAHQYAKDSLQFCLLGSQTHPIGLQMVEEYKNDRGNTYYKCFLCGAHGKFDAMYNHIINKRHTEKYIKTSIDLETSILTSNEREHLRKHIIDRHGINVEAIKIIRGTKYYPRKWETEGRTFAKTKVKKERRSMSHSPSPDPSRFSNRSPSPSWGKWRGKDRQDSPSPSRIYKRSPSRQRSLSSSPSPSHKGKSKNRRDSRSPSRTYKKSPSSRRARSHKKSRSRRERKRSSSSSSSASQSSQRSQSSSTHKYRIDMPSPREKGRVRGDPWEDSPRSQFRNRSPPTPARAEAQSSSWAMPGPSGYSSSTSLPTPLATSRVSTMEKGTQKVNLEELMMQLNFLVKTQHMPSSTIKKEKDVEKSLNIMFILTKTLYEVIKFNIEDGLSIQENIAKHNHQKEILKKMMGHLKTYMMPAAGMTE